MAEKINNLSVDCAIFGFENTELKVLLIKRDKEPERDKWSLPGGYVYLEQNLDTSANQVLKEQTGIGDLFLSQIGVFGDINRYPKQRVISILYCALINPELFKLIAGSHAKEVKWANIKEISKLPFDHNEMIEYALKWLKEEIWRKPILINLLPKKFPLNQMQSLYELILQENIDNRNFRKKVISQGLVKKLKEKTSGGQQRPAYLYKLIDKYSDEEI